MNMDQVRINELQTLLAKREQDLCYKQEELDAQRGMLSAAIEELIKKNKRLEEALCELRAKNDELSGLLYNASHGLRTPTINVQGFIELLRNEPLNEASVQYVNYLERLSDQMIEIMTTLTSLSTISRLEKDKPNLEAVEMSQLVQNNISYLHKLATSKQVKVNNLAASKSLLLNTIPVALSDVIKQILMNGIVFRQQADSGYVSIDFEKLGDTVVLTIEDNGDGIQPPIQEKIFDMFFRGSEKSGGSGLGLYLVRKATEILNGRIQFQSNQGKTVFQVTVPVNC